MVPVEDQSRPRGPYTAYVLGVLMLAFFMSYMDRQIITLLLPSLKHDLGVSDTQVSLIQGMAFASAYAFAGLPMGWIADRANRRNMIVAGVIVWSLATMACGLANSFAHLFTARMFVGLGEAVLTPACVSLLADCFGPKHRGRAISVVLAGAPAGSATSLFAGGVLLTSLTHGTAAALLPDGWAPWQIVFLAISLPGLLVAFLVSTLREPSRKADHAPPAATDTQAPGIVGFFRENASALALFYGMVACMSTLTFSVSAWAPTVLMRIYGMAPNHVGAIYGTILLTSGVAGSLVSGAVSDLLVRRWRLQGRILIPVFGFPVEIAAQATFMLARDPAMVISAMAVAAFTGSFIAASFYPAIQDLFPNRFRGRAAALFTLIGSMVGMGCGPTLVALVTDRVFQDEMMLQNSVGIVAVSASILAFLMSLGLPSRYARVLQAHGEESPPQPNVLIPAPLVTQLPVAATPVPNI